MLSRIQILLALLPIVGTAAETGSVSSAVMGYVVRPEVPELRAMLGVPGSARFSDPIPLPDGTMTAEVAPGHAWVLAIRATEAVAYFPDSRKTIALPVNGVPASWAFSPQGSRVALAYPDRGEVVLVSGLPGVPKIEATLKITSLDAFAISDNGSFLYNDGSQMLAGAGQFLYSSDKLGIAAFEPCSDLFVLFDGSTSSLMEVSATSGSSRVVYAGLGFTPNILFAGKDRIYVGSSAAGAVARVEYADGSITSQSVNVSRIAPSAIAGTMVVSAETDGPAWLMNSQGVSFVPAVVEPGVQ